MNKRYVPFALAENIFSISPDFFVRIGVKYLLCDLDNTLDSYKTPDPSSRTIAYVKSLKERGIKFYIASNNTSKRVRRYAKELGVEALSGLLKPFSFKLKKLIKKEGFPISETLMVGDQIMTDVISGNGAGIRVILTKPVSEVDPPYTSFNRMFEKRKRREIVEKGLAKPWEEIL